MKIDKLIKKQPFKDKIAVICGGSKGMGKETAKYIVKMGGNVCIIARNKEILQKASEEMMKLKTTTSQFIEIISCDTTDMEKLKPLLTNFIKKHSTPDYLFNFVGYAYAEYIEKLTLEDFKINMNINYYGQLVPILILLPYFIKKHSGHIANVSSMMGYFGIMGYCTYTPSKFAITGLSESLRHELKPYNINVSVIYPPDTDTPGLKAENKIKPKELIKMSESAKLLSAEKVAGIFIKGVLKKKFHILPGDSYSAWQLKRFLPKVFYWFFDSTYRKILKKRGKTK